MKRRLDLGDKEDDDSSSSEESSSSDTESEAEDRAGKLSRKSSEAKSAKRKAGGIDFEALRRHGYKGGLSVLSVPPPKEPEKTDWTWSTGRERTKDQESEESYKEREKTRAAIADGEELATAITQKEKKSFAQKEKRKRDLGQSSRGKNYVEEEKRLLRDNGVYSGFDC